MKKNSYFVLWDYDTPYSYKNNWKYDKNLKSYKRNLLSFINQIDNKLYLVSKILILKDGTKIKNYNNKTKIDNIFTVMIFKKLTK